MTGAIIGGAGALVCLIVAIAFGFDRTRLAREVGKRDGEIKRLRQIIERKNEIIDSLSVPTPERRDMQRVFEFGPSD